MALVPTESAQYTSSQSQDKVQGIYDGSKVRCAYAMYTVTTAGTGTVNMLTLPQGRIMIHLDLSRVYVPDEAQATSNLSIGHAAYRQQGADSDTAADPNEWIDAVDVGGGVIDLAFAAGVKSAQVVDELNSKSGIVVTATIDTADIDIGATIELAIYYSQEN